MKASEAASVSVPLRVSAVYERTLKPTDIFFNVFICRPMAAVFVRWLAPTRIVPHQVTLLSLAVAGVACATLLFARWPWGLWGGVGLLEVSYVLDKADGMLARWRGTASVQGQLLDFLMDEIKAFAFLASMSIAAFRQSGEAQLLIWGLVGLVGLASGIGLTTFLRRPEVAGAEPRAQEGDAGKAGDRRGFPIGALEAVGRFFIHYPSYVWLAAVLSDVRVYLYPYAVINVLYAGRSMLGVVLRFGRP